MNYSKQRNHPGDTPRQPAENIIAGRNPVMEALRSGKTVEKILVASGEREGSIRPILALAKERSIPVSDVARARLDALSGVAGHQGVIAYVTPFEYCEIEDILADAEQKNEPPVLLLLDGVTDPHNVGALLRTACCCGVHGVVLSKHNSCGMTPTVIKSSAGACSYMKVARVTNLTDTIEELKTKGIWVYGADGEGKDGLYNTDLTGACAIVMGDEGKGISRLVREHCDFLVRIPMHGPLNSLNVSVAGAVILYEMIRQKENRK